jgi:riboflavin kinase, archaea type
MDQLPIISGVIFSDLGQASVFMNLDWVQTTLTKCLGFTPFPATLNVRPRAQDDAQTWAMVREESSSIALPSEDGFCSARLYRIRIHGPANGARIDAAVLVPNVVDYPKDKIEIVAPVQLKTTWAVRDGDSLTLEFVH